MRRVEIEIKDGQVILNGEDFGPDCLQLTSEIEQALGVVVERQIKPQTQAVLTQVAVHEHQ